MISEQSLRQTLLTVLGQAMPKNLNVARIAEQLNALSETHKVALSSYGYVMWVIEHGGMQGIYRNGLGSAANMDGYAKAARKYKEDMPSLLVNASQYVDRVFNIIQDTDLCMTRLEDMTFPYVLWILFAAADQRDFVEKYRKDAEEHMRRYPGTLQLLPTKFQLVGEEVFDADHE